MTLLAKTLVTALGLVAHAHAFIVNAQGASGSPASLGLLVDPNNPNDANIIRQAEIVANVVNECGRTLAAGNMDIGENEELALAAGNVTQVTQGSDVSILVRPVDAAGAGPYVCDLDPTGNALGNSGQTNLTVAEAQPDKNGDITLTVTMPADLTCVGASTGDVCTVRCRNANEVGGCFAVQQTDTTPKVNTPQNIETQQQLAQVLQQVSQNQADLVKAAAGIAAAGPDGADQGVKLVEAILGTAASGGDTVAATTTSSAAATATATPSNGNGRGNRNGRNGRKNGKNNNKRDSSALRWAERDLVAGEE